MVEAIPLATGAKPAAQATLYRREWFKGTLRVLMIYALSVAIYFIILQFGFPGYIAPLAAHHSDEYGAAQLALQERNPFHFWNWVRPVSFIFADLVGHFGFEGSMASAIALLLLNLALLLFVLERRLRKPFPIWILILSIGFALSAPFVYLSAGFDVPSSLALFFGILGILSLETSVGVYSLCFASLTFTLSAFSKEGFIPISVLYTIAAAFASKEAAWKRLAIVATAMVAAFAAFLRMHLGGSTFVNLDASPSEPYFINLAPESVLKCFWLYIQALLTPSTLTFASVLTVLVFIRKRLLLASIIVVAACVSLLPYSVLPNHLFAYYTWQPFPFLMLLIPCALVPSSALLSRKVARTSVALACILAVENVAAFSFQQRRDPGAQWSLSQQNINRNLLSAVRAHARDIRASRSVLVCGLTFPFHPWEYPDFISNEIGYLGQWYLAQDAATVASQSPNKVVPIGFNLVKWNQFDTILIFRPDGTLAGDFDGTQMNAILGPHAPPVVSNADLVNRVDKHPFTALRTTYRASGVTFRATPNLIAMTGSPDPAVEISWNAPAFDRIEVHVASPNGPIFASAGHIGRYRTGNWIERGEAFFLEDGTHGNAPQHVLAEIYVTP